MFPIPADTSDGDGRGRARRAIAESVALVACVVGAMLLVLLGSAIRDPLWVDDLFSLRTARLPHADILRETANYRPYRYDHPPIYFHLLRETVRMLGDSPVAGRAPSMFLVAAFASLAALSARRRGLSLATACALGAALALHPYVAFQATSVRMYPLVLVLCAVALAAADRVAERAAGPARRLLAPCVAISLSLAAIVLTNYFGVFFGFGMGALGVLGILFPKTLAPPEASEDSRAGRRAGVALVASCFGSLVPLLLWAPTLARLVGAESRDDVVLDLPARIAQVIDLGLHLAGIYHVHLPTGVDRDAVRIGAILAIPLLGGWASLIAFGGADRARLVARWVAFTVVPFVLLVASSPPQRVLYVRYLLWGALPILEGAAFGWDRLAARVAAGRSDGARRAIPLAAFGLLLGLFAWQYHRHTMPARPDWWRAARILESNVGPGEVVLTGGYLSGDVLEYHMAAPRRIRFLHEVFEMDPFYLACRNPAVTWYVNSSPLPEGYAAIVQRYFPYRTSIHAYGAGPEMVIEIRCKRPFRLPEGDVSPYEEPIPLEWERRRRFPISEPGRP